MASHHQPGNGGAAGRHPDSTPETQRGPGSTLPGPRQCRGSEHPFQSFQGPHQHVVGDSRSWQCYGPRSVDLRQFLSGVKDVGADVRRGLFGDAGSVLREGEAVAFSEGSGSTERGEAGSVIRDVSEAGSTSLRATRGGKEGEAAQKEGSNDADSMPHGFVLGCERRRTCLLGPGDGVRAPAGAALVVRATLHALRSSV